MSIDSNIVGTIPPRSHPVLPLPKSGIPPDKGVRRSSRATKQSEKALEAQRNTDATMARAMYNSETASASSRRKRTVSVDTVPTRAKNAHARPTTFLSVKTNSTPSYYQDLDSPQASQASNTSEQELLSTPPSDTRDSLNSADEQILRSASVSIHLSSDSDEDDRPFTQVAAKKRKTKTSLSPSLDSTVPIDLSFTPPATPKSITPISPLSPLSPSATKSVASLSSTSSTTSIRPKDNSALPTTTPTQHLPLSSTHRTIVEPSIIRIGLPGPLRPQNTTSPPRQLRSPPLAEASALTPSLPKPDHLLPRSLGTKRLYGDPPSPPTHSPIIPQSESSPTTTTSTQLSSNNATPRAASNTSQYTRVDLGTCSLILLLQSVLTSSHPLQTPAQRVLPSPQCRPVESLPLLALYNPQH